MQLRALLLTIGLLASLGLWASAVLFVPLASAAEPVATSSRVPIPVVPKGKGDKCVADTAFMRRNHMKMLMHQRDDTMRNGIRTEKFSLKQCIDCHAVKGSDGKAVTVKSPEHFCRKCHDYVAVKMDCFQCHASRPDTSTPTGKAALLRGHGKPGPGLGQPGQRANVTIRQSPAIRQNNDIAALADYLRGAAK